MPEMYLREGDRQVEGFVVGREQGEAEVRKRLPVEAAEFRIGEGAGNLPGPVAPEIVENDGVAVLYAGRRPVVPDQRRLHKLICDPALVAGLQGCGGIGKYLAFSMHEQVVRPFDPLPAPVAVHRIIAPHDRCDPARTDFLRLLLEITGVSEAAVRVGVTAVRKSMDAHPVS